MSRRALTQSGRDLLQDGEDGDEHRWQDERARDEEGGTGMKRLVPAETDRKNRANAASGSNTANAVQSSPVGALAETAAAAIAPSASAAMTDDVSGGKRGQPVDAAGLPADLCCNCGNAHGRPQIGDYGTGRS